jgi:hypothetical protein
VQADYNIGSYLRPTYFYIILVPAVSTQKFFTWVSGEACHSSFYLRALRIHWLGDWSGDPRHGPPNEWMPTSLFCAPQEICVDFSHVFGLKSTQILETRALGEVTTILGRNDCRQPKNHCASGCWTRRLKPVPEGGRPAIQNLYWAKQFFA